MKTDQILLLSVFATLCAFPHSGADTAEKGIDFEDMNLNPMQKSYLNRFKSTVLDELPEPYMRTDMYLIKWLKATEFKIDDAVQKIRKMVQWRHDYNMSNILNEDFSGLDDLFPVRKDAVDKIGRPVGTADIAEWDIRKVVLMGDRDKAMRFVFRMAEYGVRRVMEQHEKNPKVTSGIIIINMAGFNTKIHACGDCIPVVRNLMVALESYFPFMIYRFFVINAPMSALSVFNSFSNLLKKHVRNVIKIHGTDKRQWKAAILQLIPPDQIEPQFGGTRIYRSS